jgi:hypothetical protein
VLVADSGYYYNALDSAVFRGNVQVADSLQYIEADSMFTRRSDEYYELHGRVFLDDQENRTRLTGGFVLSDSTGYRRVEGGSRMRRISEDLSDTTFLWADWLEVHQKDTINTFSAYDEVHIWTESYSSISDTAHYDDAVEQFILEGDPQALVRGDAAHRALHPHPAGRRFGALTWSPTSTPLPFSAIPPSTVSIRSPVTPCISGLRTERSPTCRYTRAAMCSIL